MFNQLRFASYIGRVLPPAVVLSIAIGTAALAQSYPSKPVRFLSPGSPGTTADLIPRLLGEIMGKRMGTTFAVENRAGGNGLLSANAMIAAPADGHTLLMSTMGTLAMNPHVLPSMPFDPKSAVLPLALAATMPMVLLINPQKIKAASLKEFVEWGKGHPGFTYASAGDASSAAITMMVLGKQTGMTATHVAFRGYGPGMEGVIKGEIDAIAPDIGSALGTLTDGKLRAIGVTTTKRSPSLPEIPTFREQGYDFDIELWFGFFAKPGTPPEIVEKLTSEIKYAMSQPEIQQRWKSMGLTPGDKFGKDFEQYYQDDLVRWAKVLPPLGIKMAP